MGRDRGLTCEDFLSDREETSGESLQLWRGLEELGPNAAPKLAEQPRPDAVDRRAVLNFMTASLALGGLAGCAVNRQPWGAPLLSRPRLSPQHTPGVPLMFATSLELDGVGRGVLVKSHDGRPVKIEGNPHHPASLGATDVFAQAEVLALYDPDRSKVPMAGGTRRSWAEVGYLFTRLKQQFQANGGRGLRILMQPCASPTRERLIGRVRQVYPEAGWHFHAPLADEQAQSAAMSVFGRPVGQVLDLTQADVIVAFGGDLLGAGAGAVRYAADYAERRRAKDRPLPRLYAVEASPSLTSARADRRLAVAPREAEAIALQVLDQLRRGAPAGNSQGFAAVIAGELRASGPRGLVVAGREQSAVVQAIAHAINVELGAAGHAVRYIDPVFPASNDENETLAALARAIAGGSVEALLILGGNPAYDAPGDLEFARLLSRVPMTLHLGDERDETSLACKWHLPARHTLESWGDLRAFDGTAGLCQPATVPLVEATTAEEVLALLADEPGDGHALVQATWRQSWGDDFDARWTRSLEDGVIAETAASPVAVAIRAGWSPQLSGEPAAALGQTVVFAPDPAVWDGRFSGNAWLQELPKPLTKQVWGNAALMAHETAAGFGLRSGDIALFTHDGRGIEAPVLLLPGHAQNVTTLTLGYGRRAGGRIADRGFDAYRLRSSNQPWVIEGVTVVATGSRADIVSTQHHHSMEGRDIIRVVPAAAPVTEPARPRASLYPNFIYDGVAWGMAIDLDTCLGCNACVIACQAENNVPVVGPEQTALGREMHWLRIDRYYAGSASDPHTYFQPVLCMHCERAPCEVVCPVNATVHSSEGLNQMVYVRCVGTRTCSNNCPYKVRRFNWFNYNRQEHEFALPDEVQNPEVTARWRGVIEKCTYCVHRIRMARITARMQDRPIADGEVVTACQQACPTKAIVFGDINDPDSAVSSRKADPRNYALLGELNTQPRTTYLARIADASPARATGEHGDDTG